MEHAKCSVSPVYSTLCTRHSALCTENSELCLPLSSNYPAAPPGKIPPAPHHAHSAPCNPNNCSPPATPATTTKASSPDQILNHQIANRQSSITNSSGHHHALQHYHFQPTRRSRRRFFHCPRCHTSRWIVRRLPNATCQQRPTSEPTWTRQPYPRRPTNRRSRWIPDNFWKRSKLDCQLRSLWSSNPTAFLQQRLQYLQSVVIADNRL